MIGLESLEQLPLLAAGEWAPERPEPLPLLLGTDGDGPDLADLRGQRHLRYALEVAAAGGHSLLMIGPPGRRQVPGGAAAALDPAAAGAARRRSRWRGSPAPAGG